MITVMLREHCRQMYMWHEVAFNYPLHCYSLSHLVPSLLLKEVACVC